MIHHRAPFHYPRKFAPGKITESDAYPIIRGGHVGEFIASLQIARIASLARTTRFQLK